MIEARESSVGIGATAMKLQIEIYPKTFDFVILDFDVFRRFDLRDEFLDNFCKGILTAIPRNWSKAKTNVC